MAGPLHVLYSSRPGQLQPDVDGGGVTQKGLGVTAACVTPGKSFRCFRLLFSHLLREASHSGPPYPTQW